MKKQSIINLPSQFKCANKDTYPPFKNGLYLEEYFSAYISRAEVKLNRTFIDGFWTNMQIDNSFKGNKEILQVALDKHLDPSKKYFTVVQYDDGVLLSLPKDTIVFGACTGDIPLPLIYEDKTETLKSQKRLDFNDKKYLCSFVGALTHTVRNTLSEKLKNHSDFIFSTKSWSANVDKNSSDKFIQTTLNSKFVLAPRGYGRSSFRFFEIFQLGSIPVYVWDDTEWLPYKDIIDYTKICVSINVKNIDKLPSLLKAITRDEYNDMLKEYNKVEYLFTLQGMSEYILQSLST